ncbi:MAG: PD-(D/E)XK nuclease domain-containing protein [Treponema sp.]
MKGRAEEAIAQIKELGYAEKHKASNKNIFLIGASIARGKRTLGKWVVEKV